MNATVLQFPRSGKSLSLFDEVLEAAFQEVRTQAIRQRKYLGSAFEEEEATTGIDRQAGIAMLASFILQAAYREKTFDAHAKESERKMQKLIQNLSREPNPPPAA